MDVFLPIGCSRDPQHLTLFLSQRKRPNQKDRNTKQGRGGRAPVREGKRAYDRRSGTGRGKEIKKGGGGAHNWGSDKNEAKQHEGASVEEAIQDNTETELAEEAEPKPEDNTISFEEYLASSKEKTGLLAPVQERVIEDNAFAHFQAKKVQETDFLVMGGAKQKKNKSKEKEIKTVDVAFRVQPSDSDTGRGGEGRGRGGRGRRDGRGGRQGRDGRGRGTGRDGRGGGREGRGGGRGRGRSGGRRGGGLNVMDPNAFPSL